MDTEEADWADIKDRPGYQIHRDGRVRSRWKQGGDVRKYGVQMGTTWRVLRPAVAGAGYLSVNLGRDKGHTVHRLLAEAFIPNPKGLRTVNHKDGNKLNNALSNLEWASHSDNVKHACRTLGKRIGERQSMAKLTWNDVWDIRTLRSFGASYPEMSECFGVAYPTICSILKGRTWKFFPVAHSEHTTCQV